MWRIEYGREAAASLRRMPTNTASLIRDKLAVLAADPRRPNNNVKRLSSRPGFRLRVGGWRVIYELVDSRLVVLVIAIGPRASVYDRR